VNYLIDSEKKMFSKIELFDNNLNNSNILQMEKNKYICIASSGGVEIYETKNLTLYYKINFKKACYSFYLENLSSTNEAYLYSVWEEGSILIHSLKNKKLIKEVNYFNLSKHPVYSICYLDDKTFIVGGNKIIYIVNHSNEKSATNKIKDLDSKVISVKIVGSFTNDEMMISSTSDGTVQLWSK
jgi:hypothetical protein